MVAAASLPLWPSNSAAALAEYDEYQKQTYRYFDTNCTIELGALRVGEEVFAWATLFGCPLAVMNVTVDYVPLGGGTVKQANAYTYDSRHVSVTFSNAKDLVTSRHSGYWAFAEGLEYTLQHPK